MNEPLSSPEYLTSFLRGLKRHWGKSLFFYLAAMALLVGILLIVPRGYESQGKFFVRFGRGGITLDPTTTTSQTVQIMESREAEVNSVAEILNSRSVIDQVVDMIGVERILESKFLLAGWVKLPELPSFSAASADESVDENADYATMKRREKAIRKISEDLKVKPAKKAATVSVACRASSPRLAQEIVQTMMDTYLEMHIEAHRTDGSHQFFVDQFARLETEYQSANEKMRDFKNRIGVTSIEGKRDSLQLQINQVELDSIATETDLASATERETALRKQYDELEPRLITEEVEGHTNGAGDRMRDRLYALEIVEKELLAKLTDSHPQVRQVRGQIAEARSIMNGQPATLVQTKTAVNPTRLSIEGRLLQAGADRRAMQAKLEALAAKRAGLVEQLEALNTNEAQLAILERELEVAQSNHRKYAEKLEEARINRELDTERISNVKVVQPATLTLKPVSPKRLLILVLGSCVAFVAALGLTQIFEALNQSLRTPEELASQVDVPVLATLPRSAAREVLVTSK